ncbi:hypothetical protein H2201_009014 [Coniosporium apollinis]|uniref:Uncharacterized protein n=2 Tax=Coniosporium TaxID=2810619 RepID=A0ABQ9NEW2_9PEZI|nr:hypothetical protein H2199_009287 [Cladosporium sp. JES 115]KAJ9654341.1 hypothetical protein H2201_009014 [Coniosporium apollinis]
MTLKHAAWAHGNSVQLEDSSWRAVRRGPSTTVYPSNVTSAGWLHVPIHAPVIIDEQRMHVFTALALFNTGPGAKVVSFHVHDGDRRILARDGLNLTGRQNPNFDVPDHPEVFWGTSITLGVHFVGQEQDKWISVIAAGINFHN